MSLALFICVLFISLLQLANGAQFLIITFYLTIQNIDKCKPIQILLQVSQDWHQLYLQTLSISYFYISEDLQQEAHSPW